MGPEPSRKLQFQTIQFSGGRATGTVGGKDVNAQMSGSFLGADAEAVRGVIADGAGAAGAFNGAFIVAR